MDNKPQVESQEKTSEMKQERHSSEPLKGKRPSLPSLLRWGLLLARASITSWILHSSFWIWMCRWLGGSVCGSPANTGALWVSTKQQRSEER